jgi:hypothetical protein
MLRRWLRLGLVLLIVVPLSAGCFGFGKGDKGKNQDLDRPKASDTRR